MNTMSRDFIVLVCNKSLSANISLNDAYNIIYSYCIDKGKEPSLTSKFCNILCNGAGNFFLESYLKTALDYYNKKCNIIEIKDIKTGRIIKYL